ncbi:hypothetical protein GCM10023223_51130 [Stackebrandtia albiflava]
MGASEYTHRPQPAAEDVNMPDCGVWERGSPWGTRELLAQAYQQPEHGRTSPGCRGYQHAGTDTILAGRKEDRSHGLSSRDRLNRPGCHSTPHHDAEWWVRSAATGTKPWKPALHHCALPRAQWRHD